MVQVQWDQPIWLDATEDYRLTGVVSLAMHDVGSGPIVYSTTRVGGGGITAHRVTDSRFSEIDAGVLSGKAQVGQDSTLLLDMFGDTLSLAVTGVNDAGLWIYDVAGNGEIPSVGRALPGANLSDDLDQALILDVAGQRQLIATTPESGQFQRWRIGDDGELTALSNQSTDLSSQGDSILALGEARGGASFVLALSDGADILSSYRVQSDGKLSLAGRHRQEDGLGIGGAAALETLEVAGETYIVVAASGSSSLSVFHLHSTGRLDPVDHLMDDPDTRFGRATHLETFTVGDVGYVLVAGDEDGVSLFQILPGGRLLHLSTLEDTLETGLADVSALALIGSDGRLGVGVASATEPGLTWFWGQPDAVGLTVTDADSTGALRGTSRSDVLVGDDGAERLIGGSGNDVLSDGAGADTLSGGDGADVFVFSTDGTMDTITDFQLGIDRLDLSNWAFLRNPGQLTVHTRANGADIAFGDELLRITTRDGQPLTLEDIVAIDLFDGDRMLPNWPQVQRSMVLADTGTSKADKIIGSQAMDIMIGGGGNDTLMAAGGDDRLDGGAGADHMNGGPGSDVFIVDHADDQVIESPRWSGHDRIEARVDTWLRATHVEDLTLTGGGDIRGIGNGLSNVIIGNNGDNILDGGKNNDTLIGGQGNDTYLVRAPGDTVIENPGEGLDTVRAFRSLQVPDGIERLHLQGTAPINGVGNETDNIIVGNMGDNILSGRGGNDTLKGQGGDDVFVFDRTPGRGNVDRVVDFISGEDRLWIKASLFDLPSGGVRPGMLHMGDKATESHHRVLFDSKTGAVRVDPDGSGPESAHVVFILEGDVTLAPQDLLLF